MTTAAQAVAAVDELASQIQAFVEDSRFVPQFFDRLFGLRTVLGDARERFAADHAGTSAELPLFGDVLDHAIRALLAGEGLVSTNADVGRYGRTVEQVIKALSPSPVPTRRGRRRTT